MHRALDLGDRDVPRQLGGAAAHPLDVEDDVGGLQVRVLQRGRVLDRVELTSSTGPSTSRPRAIRAWPIRTARIQPAYTGQDASGFQSRLKSHSPR